MFDKATKLKLRFQTTKGSLTTEDLWDLPLSGRASLDTLAKSLNKALKEDGEESFVSKPTTKNAKLSLQFDVVKHIIGVRIAEADASENSAKNKAEKDKILNIISRKQDAELEGKSVEELKESLKSLG